MLLDGSSLVTKMERRDVDADADTLPRGRFLTRLTARRFHRGAGTRAVPDAGEPRRSGRGGTDSGEGCPGLTQVGPTLAWTNHHLTSTILTLSSIYIPVLITFIGSPHQCSSFLAVGRRGLSAGMVPTC
jgi:hypothetical protein